MSLMEVSDERTHLLMRNLELMISAEPDVAHAPPLEFGSDDGDIETSIRAWFQWGIR